MVALVRDHAGLRDVLGTIPSVDAAHRFGKKLREHQAVLTRCIERVLTALHDAHPEMGQTVAIDSSDLPAYANGQKYVSRGGALRKQPDRDRLAARSWPGAPFRPGPAGESVCCAPVISRPAVRLGPGRRQAVLLAAVLAVPLLAGCGLLRSQAAGSPSPGAPVPAASQPDSVAARPPCPAAPARFSCLMRRRIAAVERFLTHRPGMIGIVLRDRAAGAVWRNKYARTPVYMASTSKLAMAVTLLLQNQAGVIHLGSADWDTLSHMLHVSSDSAADDLWFKYGASFYTSFFPRTGLTSAQYLPQAGVPGPYWGEMTCPATNLSALINYVLTDLPAPLRSYLEDQLRHVAADQHFGVWGAGAANQPGNKDGWSVEKPGWIINSVGFAGPGARYTLAMMNSLNGEGGYRAGTDTVTQVAALLFRGHKIAAPQVRATP